MKRRKNWIQNLSETMDLPGEPMPGIPLVELAGDNRVLIENHGPIVEYGPERIRVVLKYGQLCICGHKLTLGRMSHDQLVVSGTINSLTIIRRC